MSTFDTNYLYCEASVSCELLRFPSTNFALIDVRTYFLNISQVCRLYGILQIFFIYYLVSPSNFHVTRGLNCVFGLDLITLLHMFLFNMNVS
jgi:hypothetical protein